MKPSYEILTPIDGNQILQNIEKAGRICYKSEAKITDDSAKKFVANIIKSGHESVIEHENISIKLIVDRSITHEIVRHRLCSYSQESTRYCNYKHGVTFIIPPWININEGEYKYEERFDLIGYPTDLHSWFYFMLECENTYLLLLDYGWTPQQARSVLPNSLKTEIIMTCNLREWRHVLKLRTSSKAHPQMREIMVPLLGDLQRKIPIIFDDIII